ncbi:MAG: hypothetical protein WCC11_01270 [Gammaproteobacteria bacterium]
MSLLDVVRREFDNVFTLHVIQDSVHVTTQCIYPTNDFVQVSIRGGSNSFYVTDNGGAIRDIETAGAEFRNPEKLLHSILKSYGLEMANGIIRSYPINARDLPAMVAVVANASMECAEFLFRHAKIKVQRDLKKLVSQYLSKTFDDRVIKDQVIVGKSNKPHKFDNVVKISSDKRLIVDAVIYQSTAINAHVLANLDVANAQYPDIEQRIIYDDAENWLAEDLNLLQMGGTVVPFSHAPDVIQRIASTH